MLLCTAKSAIIRRSLTYDCDGTEGIAFLEGFPKLQASLHSGANQVPLIRFSAISSLIEMVSKIQCIQDGLSSADLVLLRSSDIL